MSWEQIRDSLQKRIYFDPRPGHWFDDAAGVVFLLLLSIFRLLFRLTDAGYLFIIGEITGFLSLSSSGVMPPAYPFL